MIPDHSSSSSLSPHREVHTLILRRSCAFVLGLLGLAAAAAAPGQLAAQQEAPAGPSIPAPRGMVNDFANVIPPDQAARIEALASEVRAKSGGEIAVVTLSDIGARDVGDVALRIGREWKVGAAAKIGDATRNAGVVILVVPKETSKRSQGPRDRAGGAGKRGVPHRRRRGRYLARGDPLHAAEGLRRRDRTHDPARRATFRRELQLLARFRRAGAAPGLAANAGRPRISSPARVLHLRAARAPPLAGAGQRVVSGWRWRAAAGVAADGAAAGSAAAAAEGSAVSAGVEGSPGGGSSGSW